MKTTRRAWKSILISKKESLSYLLTLILSASLLFVFINIQNDANIQASTLTLQQRSIHTLLLNSCTLIVAIICAINCYVANTYFVKAKNKELCVYLSCGMRITKLAYFLIIQNMILLIFAIGISFLLGCFLHPLFNIFITMLTQAKDIVFRIYPKGIMMWFIILFFEMFFLILINIGYTYRMELKDFIDESRSTKLPDFRTIRFPVQLYPILCILSWIATFFIPTTTSYAITCTLIAFLGLKGYIYHYVPYKQEKKRRKHIVTSSESMILQGNLNALHKTSYMYYLMNFLSLLIVLCLLIGKTFLQSTDIIVLLAYFLIILMMQASIYFKLIVRMSNYKHTFHQLSLLGLSKKRIHACRIKEILYFYSTILCLPLPYVLTLGVRFLLTDNLLLSIFIIILGWYMLSTLLFMMISIRYANAQLKQLQKKEKQYELCD